MATWINEKIKDVEFSINTKIMGRIDNIGNKISSYL